MALPRLADEHGPRAVVLARLGLPPQRGRGIGEGHRSSIGFRTGVVDPAGGTDIDEPAPFAATGGTAGGMLRRSRRFVRAQRYVSGTVYIGLGVATAFAGSVED